MITFPVSARTLQILHKSVLNWLGLEDVKAVVTKLFLNTVATLTWYVKIVEVDTNIGCVITRKRVQIKMMHDNYLVMVIGV